MSSKNGSSPEQKQPGAGVYEVPAAELKALVLELADALSLILALSLDMAEAGQTGTAQVLATYLFHEDDEVLLQQSFFARFPELQEAARQRSAEFDVPPDPAPEDRTTRPKQCAAYPNCSCGNVEKALANTDGPLQ